MGFISKLPTSDQYRAQANAYMDEAKLLCIKMSELHDKAESAMAKSISAAAREKSQAAGASS